MEIIGVLLTMIVRIAPVITMVMLFVISAQLGGILRLLKHPPNVKFSLHYPDEKKS